MNTMILRCEESLHERRAPLTPQDAASLVRAGFQLLVEASPQRIFPDDAYRDQGCELIPRGSWRHASSATHVLGIKALPEDLPCFEQTHLFFAHAYRGQPQSTTLLQKFKEGGGVILDLEYLVDQKGMRLVSFSRFAGIAGAIVGLNALLPHPYPLAGDGNYATWCERLRLHLSRLQSYRYVITGAEGRCGNGVCHLLDALGIACERWTLEDTLAGRPFDELANYDVLFHCAAAFSPSAPMVTLSSTPPFIVDITCDMGTAFNLLHLNHHATTFASPVQMIEREGSPVRVIAIDHLPSLLPEESSAWFSSQLLPLLLDPDHTAWKAALRRFSQAAGGVS